MAVTAAVSRPAVTLSDFAPQRDDFLTDVLHGLSGTQKTIPCKYFYDQHGSKLFDQICELDEYYPTRTEMAIMRRHAGEMAELLGPHCLLVEYGSGSGIKTRILLDHLPSPAAYVPVDISREHLLASARSLAARYEGLTVLPVCADYTQRFLLPLPDGEVRRRAAYFPGSTIGNFEQHEARDFLRRAAQICGANGGLLIGVDLQKDIATLEAAYNDSKGVTAAFNLNVLWRINNELGGDFDLSQFRHQAIYNAAESRIEMLLISCREQTVHIGDSVFHFREDETILTEYSHKYTLESFAQLASLAGWQVEKVWTDEQNLFSVQYLTTI